MTKEQLAIFCRMLAPMCCWGIGVLTPMILEVIARLRK